MKLLVFSDAHIRASTPRSRIDDYPTALWGKFQQITEIIRDRKVDAVLNGGDLFDSPDPATSIVNKYLELFKSWKVPIYSIIGSHDKFGYNDTTLYRTALGTLVAAGVTEIVGDTRVIGSNCQLAGVSHSYDLDESPSNYFRKKVNDDYMVQICHGMVTPSPFFGEYTLVGDISTSSNLVVCTHFHPGFGPITVDESTIVNIGSLGRVERTARKFQPGVIYINTDECQNETWEYVPLNVKQDVFIAKEEMVQSSMDISKFVETLQQDIDNFKCSDLRGLITTLGKKSKCSEEVIDRALEYIESNVKD